jgi:hypothetical protein
MNNRIRDLSVETDAWCDQNYESVTAVLWEQKFAELIVKSVMADLEKLRAEYANPDMYESVEYYDSMRAKESALEDAIDTIRYNFGVEE